jgi:uncharacterized protein
MTNTQSLPAHLDTTASSKQYSLSKILAIWASVTAPMAVLAFVVAPAIITRTSLYPGLVHWMLIVVGMIWQFVVSLAILRHELGGLHWPSIKKRIWLNLPRDPRTGKTRKVLFLWALPAIAANALGAYLASYLDTAWTNLLPALREPSYVRIEGLADPQFQGQWWILGLALTSLLFTIFSARNCCSTACYFRAWPGYSAAGTGLRTLCCSVCTTCTRSGSGPA